MLCAGRFDVCLEESEAEGCDMDSKGDMADPSGGRAVAISGKRDVKLKLDRCEVLAMCIGGMSGRRGNVVWEKPTGRGGDNMEPNRLFRPVLLVFSVLGLANIWLEKYGNVRSLDRLG